MRSKCARRSPYHLARRSADQRKRCYSQYQTYAQGLSSFGAITHASHMALSLRGNDLRKVQRQGHGLRFVERNIKLAKQLALPQQFRRTAIARPVMLFEQLARRIVELAVEIRGDVLCQALIVVSI